MDTQAVFKLLGYITQSLHLDTFLYAGHVSHMGNAHQISTRIDKELYVPILKTGGKYAQYLIIVISHCGIFPYTKDEESSNFCSTFGWLKSLQRRKKKSACIYLYFPLNLRLMIKLEHTEW